MKSDLQKFDMRIIFYYDSKVQEQQETMNEAGVPGFFFSLDKNEIEFQKNLLKIIQDISQISN